MCDLLITKTTLIVLIQEWLVERIFS